MGKKTPKTIKKAAKGVGRDLISQGLASMGHALGVAAAKKMKKKKEKRKTLSQSVTKHIGNVTMAGAPTNAGVFYRSIGTRRNPIVTIPFNSVSNCYLGVSAFGGSPGFVYASGSAATWTFDLNPFTNSIANWQQFAFGLGVSNLCKAFAKWRVKSLKVTYLPSCSTATNGTFVMGATGENFVSTSPTYQQVSDCERMMSGPLWSMQTMDISSVARNSPNQWLYCYISGNTVAEQRQNYCCTLLAQFFNVPTAANSAYGQIKFDGELEFTDMSDVIGGFTSTSSSTLPPQASVSVVSSPPVIQPVKVLDSQPTDTSREVSGSMLPNAPNSLGPDGRWYIPSTIGPPSQR